VRAGDDEDLLAGYVSGPAAATEATAVALARAEGARTVVLVEAHIVRQAVAAAGQGRGGAAATLPRRRSTAQAPLRAPADRGHRPGPDAAAAHRPPRRRL